MEHSTEKNNTYRKVIQNNIIRLTSQTNTSYRELSTAIDASPSYVQKLVEDKFEPSLSNLSAIAEYFEIPLSALFSDSSAGTDKTLIPEITDYLVKLNDNNLELVLTLTKELYKKQT